MRQSTKFAIPLPAPILISNHFLVAALGSRRNLLVQSANDSANPSSPYYKPSVNALVTKLEGGHQLSLAGKSPSEHDPESLKVIWGHIHITDREALLHFLTCHYLGQYFAEVLSKEKLPFAAQKDFFVNSLADIVLINHTQSGQADQIYHLWTTSKQNGGMGWISDARRKAYGL